MTQRILLVMTLWLLPSWVLAFHPYHPMQENGQVETRKIRIEDSKVEIILHGETSYQVNLDGKGDSRKMPQRKLIRLGYDTFDPLIRTPDTQLPELLKFQPNGGETVYIVQFVTQALAIYQKEIHNLGGTIFTPLHDHALLVLLSAKARDTLAKKAYVRYIGIFQPAYKLEAGLERLVRSLAPNQQRYSILVFKKGMQDKVAENIKAVGGSVELVTSGRRLEASLNGKQLQEIAAMNEVLYIDRWLEAEDDMDQVRRVSGANFLETAEVPGYSGQGVRGEVLDDGVRATHLDFQNNPPLIHVSNDSDINHGTQTYAIVFGDGASSAQAKGLLPNAEQPIFMSRHHISDRPAHTAALVDPLGTYRAVFQTNSWGNGRTFGDYTSFSVEMDQMIFDTDLLILNSQSNQGTQESRPQAWAKNVVSVGGIQGRNTDTLNDDCWCNGASTGPADDGRIKPDLSHFYGDVFTSRWESNTAHGNFGGTSGATPIVAGLFGLMFQMWADGVFDGGPGQLRDVFDLRPHAATAKALMIHSARQYSFTGSTSDLTRIHQGWGFPNARNLYDIAEANLWQFNDGSSSHCGAALLIDESQILEPLQTHSYCFEMDGLSPLKATLVFKDPPGIPNSIPNRINDLSLKVTSPSQVVYWGNNGLLTGNWSSSGGTSNTVDTVENVFIQNAEAGIWTIAVVGDEIVADAHTETPALDADYALVVTRDNSGPPGDIPPSAPANFSANATGETTINLNWDDNSEADLAGYHLFRGTTSGGPYAQINTALLTNSAFFDTNLNQSTTYFYVVRAVDNTSQVSLDSVEATATTLGPPDTTPPTPPDGLLATATGATSIDLDWTDNSEIDLAGYNLFRANNAGGPYAQVNGSLVTLSAFEDTGLASSTAYFYRVTAVDTTGNQSVQSVEVSASTDVATATLGNTQILTRRSSSLNRRAMPFVMPEDGTIRSISMYHGGGNGNMILAVYGGATSPGQLLAITATTPRNATAGFQSIDLISPVSITGGTQIHLAWVYSTAPNIAYDAGTPGRFQVSEGFAAGLPDPFGNSSQANWIYSIYASYTTQPLVQHTLTANPSGQGSISLNPAGGTYNQGTLVTATATPASGWQFDGWSGDLNGSTNPASITMDTNKTITATFSLVPQFSLTTNTVGQGSVSLNPASGTYNQGTLVTATPSPASGWQFDGWSGDLNGSTNPASITMDTNKTITATFSLVPQFSLTTNTVGQGSISLNPAGGTYNQGTLVTATATPASGWQFDGWSGDLNGTNSPISITMDTNKNITASFTEVPISLCETTLAEHLTGNDKIEVNQGQKGSQSFKVGNPGDPNFEICKIVLHLSRDAEAPLEPLTVSIGTTINGGTLAGSTQTISPSAITNNSEGSSFMAFELAFTTPLGALTSGTTYYLNFENESNNGKKYYLEYSGSNTYPNGTYYKSGDNDGKDIWFQLIGN